MGKSKNWKWEKVWEPCGKCNKASAIKGKIDVYTHVFGGVCFRCNGAGETKTKKVRVFDAIVPQAERDAINASEDERLRLKREKRHAKREAKRLEQIAFCQMMQAKRDDERAKRQAELEAKREATRLAAEPVPVSDERMKISGEIVSIKPKSFYNGWKTVEIWKMLVKDERGFKVWGSVPKGEWNVGDSLEFFARVEASKDDDRFGFYKRPTKVKMLTKAA